MKFRPALPAGLLAALLVLSGGRGVASELIVLDTRQPGAAVFQSLRGDNRFLGYTPLRLTQADLDGKSVTDILIVKPGHQRVLAELRLSEGDRTVTMKPVESLLHRAGVEPDSDRKRECFAEIEAGLRRHIASAEPTKLDLSVPAGWAPGEEGGQLSIGLGILASEDIRRIKKAERGNESRAADTVREMVEPIAGRLLETLSAGSCLTELLIVARYEERGMQIDFSPYRQTWTASESYVIGDKLVTRTAVGTSARVRTEVRVNDDTKAYAFKYFPQ